MSYKDTIQQMNEQELAELSLEETLSIEEAVCDEVDMQFLIETADMPIDATDISGVLAGNGEYDKFQFYNQDHLQGLTDEDLDDIGNPDNRGGTEHDADLHETMHSAIDATNKTYADASDPQLDQAYDDIPTIAELVGETNTSSKKSAGLSQVSGVGVDTATAFNETVQSLQSFLLGEAGADLTIDDSEAEEDEEDEESTPSGSDSDDNFLASLDGMDLDAELGDDE